MDRRRLLIVVILALGFLFIVGAVAFLFISGQITNPFSEPPTPTPVTPTITVEAGQPTPIATAIPEQEFVEVVVSLQTVPRGFQMTAAELTTEIRRAEDVQPNVITDLNQVIGLFARTDIYQGETLTTDALIRDITTIGQSDYGPSSLIPPGYVAMSVPIDRLGSVAFAMDSGDFVDILITFILFQVDEQFQSRLPNDATFFLETTVETASIDAEGETTTETVPFLYTLSPYGRFEEQPDGSIVHISPSESSQRGVHVAFLIQNAKVIQIGPWIPPVPAQLPTPTIDPELQEGDGEVAADTPQEPTPAATPVPDVALIALPPQQQLFLKYAVETNSIIDFALRGINDGELYPVENVTLEYILQRFNVEIPPNFTYVANTGDDAFVKLFADGDELTSEVIITITPTAEAIGPPVAGDGPEEGAQN